MCQNLKYLNQHHESCMQQTAAQSMEGTYISWRRVSVAYRLVELKITRPTAITTAYNRPNAELL